jgi:hypothetical protein
MSTINHNLDFLQYTFPPEFLERYRDGVMVKKSWTVRFRADEALFFGPRTFAVPNLSPAQIEATKRVVLGVRLEELDEYLTETELAEMISYLDHQDLIRPVYQNEFIGTAWEKQVEFFSDFVDDPNAAQRQIGSPALMVISFAYLNNWSEAEII